MSKSTRAEWQREQEREDVRVKYSIDNRAIESNNIENRADQRRLMRRFQNERREVEMENKLIKMKEAQLFRAHQIEQNAKFAEQLQRVKNEVILEEKKRQQIRESSEELKILEAKLRTAYSLKELDAQVAEQKLAAIQEKNKEAHINELIRGSWEKQKEERKMLECEEFMRKKQYRTELQDQMIGDEKKRQLLFQEFLKDKRMVDEIVRNIQEEDQKAEVERMGKLEKTKREIEDFQKAQAIWRKKERDELEDENKRILAYLEKQGNDEQKRTEENRLREETKAKLSNNVARQIRETELKKKEREDILQLVAEEELMAEHARKYREEIEKKLRLRVEMRHSYQQQTAEKKARLEREAAQDQVVRQQLLDKMAEDARLDQLTREKQRTKMTQFRRDVEVAMEAKRVQRAEEMQRIVRLEELSQEEEKTRRQMIEDERLRMLKEHATKLLGYIPFGVLRESDLPLLGPEFVEMYGSKQGKGGLSKKL